MTEDPEVASTMLKLRTTDHRLVMTDINKYEAAFINSMCRSYDSWVLMVENKEEYIFNKLSMRFVKRKGTKGKSIENLCKLQQFPEIYAMSRRSGSIIFRNLSN